MASHRWIAGGRALRRFAVACALALALSARADAQSVGRWSSYIDEASARFGVPADWIWRVMEAESGGRTMRAGRPITSRTGAMGLMQLMPNTWAEMRARHALGPDPHDPRDNILAGTAYLRAMYDRFGYPGLFAAYNAGPARYAEHLSTGRTLPAETIAYVADVGRGDAGAEPSHPRSVPSPLFAVLTAARAIPGEVEPDATDGAPSGLFVRLGGDARR